MHLLSQHLIDNSDFGCELTTLFEHCPTLSAVATTLLGEQWNTRKISTHLPPTLYLRSTLPGNKGDVWRPLHQLLIERYCSRVDLQLTPAVDAVVETPNDITVLHLDLGKLQSLVNECGPLLLDHYRQALVDFWNHADSGGQSPWQHYSDYLRQQLRKRIAKLRPGALEPTVIALAQEVLAPAPPSARQAQVSLLSLHLHDGLRLNDLASALVIEPQTPQAEGSTTLLYTLSGQLLTFPSHQALLQSLGQACQTLADKHPHLTLDTLSAAPFDIQARTVLEQQLQVIDKIGELHRSAEGARRINIDLAHLTSMLDLCPNAEQVATAKAAGMMPVWLQTASDQSRHDYARLLLQLAQSNANAAGKSWLDGIEDAELFTYKKISERIAIDHPEATLEPWNIQVINHQVVAAALPTGGFDGTVTTVSYSLAQLAICNLGLLRPGRIELRHRAGQPLPSWLDETYVRRLVTELNIGKVYPHQLQQTLLRDPEQKARRKHMLGEQLSAQIPAAALELHLHGKRLSQTAARAVFDVFTGHCAKPMAWVMRPVGLIRQEGEPADRLLNTWLIEQEAPGTEPCVLYRPLHAQPLVEFANRAALLTQMSRVGEFQDDMLWRLDENVRHIYANGGFTQPYLPGLKALVALRIPVERPEPVELSFEAPVTDLTDSIYTCSVEQTLRQFRLHSSTSEQTRWQQWQALGLLTLNTLLPLVGGAVGTAIWLIQVGLALKQYLQSDAKRHPTEHRLALVNLLVNAALVVLAHSLPKVRLQPAAELIETAPATPAATGAQGAEIPPAHLQTNWSQADSQLSQPQRQALAALRAERGREGLGAPLDEGHWAGVYQTGDEHWVLLGHDLYRVILDEDFQQPRIVSGTPPHSLGPWLQRDAAGQWQPDLRLRLRAGMPRSSAARTQLRLNRLSIETLSATLDHDLATGRDYIKRLDVLQNLLKADEREPSLRSNLAAIDVIAKFWDKHVVDIKRYVDLQPGTRLQSRLSLTLFQQFASKAVLHTALSKLIDLKMAESAALHLEHPEDLALALEQLEQTPTLTGQLVSNSDALRDTLTELERLASRYHEGTQQWLATARQCLKVPIGQLILSSRLRRIESAWRRLLMQPGLSERAYYLLRRGWKNLDLAISQRLRLFAMPQASAELSARLLHDMHSKLGVVQSALVNLRQELLDKPAAGDILSQLQEDVRFTANGVKSELEDHPPVSTVEQLRQNTPGLIETASHGLLLGQPRANDATLVDILDQHQRPLLTFRKEQDEWVQSPEPLVEPVPAAQPPRTSQTFVEALGKAEEQMREANQMLSFMQSKAAENFLPVEIQELLDLKRHPVEQLHATLRRRLPQEPGLAADSREGLNRRLDALRAQLTSLQHRTGPLRTAAILRQKPQMSGLRHLISQQQVSIHLVKRRKELSAVQGRAQDYLDEYEILHNGNPLWYAHFHYRNRLDGNDQYVAGHLKTCAQRSIRGQTLTDPRTQKIELVYRAPITHAEAARYFFQTQP